MSFKTLIFLATWLCAASAGAHAKIYTYLDAEGVRHYTDVPDDNRYKLLALSSHDLTRSGDHYDPAVLARATQYDSIIEKTAANAAVEPNLLRAGHRGGIRIQFPGGLQARGGRAHAAHAGHGDPLRSRTLMIRSRTSAAVRYTSSS